eukprot:TRINITY_DN48315_c0_g1_i1.p1 TRINITY_DN48315_c0_g1~~TRINITY_DN48315_c0_g1_i1.p1  ORF type:complete len:650 (+),score=85.94 TRINITY_DN48315_c0_g1_i1:422-2371(+)
MMRYSQISHSNGAKPNSFPEASRRGPTGNENEMSRMRLDLRHAIRRSRAVRARLEEVKDLRNEWNDNVKMMADEVAQLKYEVELRDRALRALFDPPQVEDHAPGPAWTAFIDSIFFSCLSALVIFVNTFGMCWQAVHSDDDGWASTDPYFMSFYTFEIGVKGIRWRRKLLCGSNGDCWWNWLDVMLVIASYLEICVLPRLETADFDGVGGDGPANISILRVVRLGRLLRLARMTRLLKLLRLFLLADVSWAEGDRFRNFMLVVIAANSFVIGLECDFSSFVLWKYLEHLFVAIFTFELAVRMKLSGFAFFQCTRSATCAWNWLDFVSVTSGIIDQWMLPIKEVILKLLGFPSQQPAAYVQTMLRFARVLRVLRLTRLVRGIPELYNLMCSMMLAMKGMVGVLMILMGFLYLTAVLSREVVAKGLVFGGEAPPNVARVFSSVPETIYLLFNLVNSGNQGDLQILYDAAPVSEVFAVIFTVVSKWGMLSILTAVITETMMRSAKTQSEEMAVRQQKDQVCRSRVKLEDIFDRLDANQSESLTLDEFKTLLADELLVEELKDATGLNAAECRNLFTYLCRCGEDGEEPYITRNAFIDGLQNESRPVSERSIMRLESRLADVERVLRAGKFTASTDRNRGSCRIIDPWHRGTT